MANSARSQLAEGLARQLASSTWVVQSAGSIPTCVHPLTVLALAEVGIDASEQRSKSVETIDPASVDTVITLCAEEVCPLFLGPSRRLHWPLPDPAAAVETREASIERFRQVRDDLIRRLQVFFAEADSPGQRPLGSPEAPPS